MSSLVVSFNIFHELFMQLKTTSQETLHSTGLLILRLWFGGAMLLAHGWPKLATFSDRLQTFADPLGIGSPASLVMAIFAEVGCAFLLMLGLGTRLVAAPLLFAMVMAAFIVHGADPWAKKEFALLYAFPYLALMLTGPGRFSLDHLIFKKYRASKS